MRWKVLSSSTKRLWDCWTSSIKTKNGVAFLTGSFLLTNSLNEDISSKKRLCSTFDKSSVVRVVFSIYTKCTNVFTFFREVLKFWNYIILSFCVCYCCQRLRTHSTSVTLFTKRFTVDTWVMNKPLNKSLKKVTLMGF